MSIESRDPWLSPDRQAEFPTRLVLSGTKLHRRREKTFLFLVTMVIVAAVAMALFGTRVVLDVNYTLASIIPDLVIPPAELAFGVLVLPLGLFGLALVTELYGRRRAYATAVAGMLASAAALGLLYASEQLDVAGVEVSAGVALAVAQLAAHLAMVPVLGSMRERTPNRRYAVRNFVATLVALVAAWAVFAFVLYAQAVQLHGFAADAVIAEIGRLVLGTALYTLAVALVVVVPFVALARGLGVYLRVGHFDDDDDDAADLAVVRSARIPVEGERERRRALPQALVVETPPPMRRDEVMAAAGASSPSLRQHDRRDKKTSIPPFSSTEMRFFTEGDELAEPAEAPVDGKPQRA